MSSSTPHPTEPPLTTSQCGEYIYKGRKFNARKETTDEKYYNITIYRFYIRCTRCSGEITFRTDPKNMDYEAEKGAKRNFEVWREAKLAEETEEERLDRLEREEAEKDAMKELESKTLDAKTEMAIADKLDEIRTRNARLERADRGGEVTVAREVVDEERERQDREDAEAARLAFLSATGERVKRLREDDDEEAVSADGVATTSSVSKLSGVDQSATPPSFVRAKKAKKDFSAALGIKRKPLSA